MQITDAGHPCAVRQQHVWRVQASAAPQAASVGLAAGMPRPALAPTSGTLQCPLRSR